MWGSGTSPCWDVGGQSHSEAEAEAVSLSRFLRSVSTTRVHGPSSRAELTADL